MKIQEIGNHETASIMLSNQQSATAMLSPSLPVHKSGSSDEWLLATHGRTFHFATRFLTPRHRRQVLTLYAFFRTLDDLVDRPEGGRRIDDIRRELEAWKVWLREDCAFPAPREPLGTKLAAILAEQPVPIAIFLDFLDGIASDLGPREIRDFSEMYRYCYSVAGTVGLAMAHILGARSAQALSAAQSLGIAMQMTNILRDVGGDLASGRIYLPQDELARFGSSRAHLRQLYREQQGPDDRFRALMQYQINRAHRYYVRGMSGIWLLPGNCRLPILVASRLYRRILTAIERNHYDVIHKRASTSFLEKVYEGVIALMLHQLWHRGESFAALETEEEVRLEV